MCTFITLGFPAATDRAALKTLLEAHHRSDREIVSPSVQALLPSGSLYLWSTRGFCDCDTALGSLRAPETSLAGPAGSDKAQTARLLRRGWSGTKIARWQAEKTATSQKRDRGRTSLRESSREEAQRWADLFLRALEPTPKGRLAEWAALFVHFYSERFEDSVPVAGTETVLLRDISAEWMLHLRFDVLYRFVPH